MSNQDKPVDPEKERRKIKSVKKMKDIMTHYYIDAKTAAETGKKVAWITSGGPVEPLIAMDVIPVYPENHGAMLGATRMATDLIPAANAVGYSPDICSYLTSDIGAYVQGETPLAKAFEGIEGIPKPDVLVFNTNQCRDVKDWFQWYASWSPWLLVLAGAACIEPAWGWKLLLIGLFLLFTNPPNQS